MIQVFSTRADKPRSYGYGEIDKPVYTPIEIAISSDGKIWTSCYDVPNMEGVYCYRSPDVPVAKRTNNTKKIGLQDGSRLMSSTYDSRDLKIQLEYDGVDETDAMLAFETAQRFFVSREAYWISFANWQNRMYYGIASMGDPNYTNEKHWLCEVTFTDLMGLSRSIGTSLSSVDDVWAVNANLPNNGDYPPFQFTTSSFSVYNLSDMLIDPEFRGHPFKMILNGKSGGNLKVTNKTDGTSIYKKSAFEGTFTLDGVNPSLNGQGCLLDTDCGVITLAIGKNDFQVENFSGTISFDFPFWWLA